ncbi:MULTISPECIES: WxL domain-containing protein [unclassified Enterococcus]|uniref:WxL domain-containing protein n=1 Tax=unclassified Enterococcus TaxID=2608891 RepID=UPI001CE08121|nr:MULTISPECIES: WxL domain-containing protein [unclassified Enterococcus]MCA5014492.1 WxL domain-containing protein [Enterococcus sp. S23]MCA5017394.1 WxL domain-containing protein [Enterococcus sp. S22(2020)]
MKNKVIASLLLSGLVLSCSATGVYAEESTAKTKAETEFTAGDRPDPSKPEEGPKDPSPLDPDPDPEDPSKPKPLPEVSNVYVTHLPDISFGSNKTNLKTTEYEALTEKRTRNQGAEAFYMPHSVQVADLSGNSDTKWKLSVHQDDIFKTKDSTPQKLTNTRIRIYGNTLTSTAYAASDLTDKVAGVAMDTTDEFGSFSTIPVVGDTQGELVVLENKTEGFTLNSYTSSVFADSYTEENYDPAKTPSAERYEGIKLNVPASDQSQAKAYSTNLTWTLTVEP